MEEIKELVKQKLTDYSQNRRMMALLSYEMEHSTPGAEVYDAMQQAHLLLAEETKRLETYVSLLEKEQRLVLEYAYFEKLPWKIVAERIQQTTRTAFRRRDAAIDQLADMYVRMLRLTEK